MYMTLFTVGRSFDVQKDFSAKYMNYTYSAIKIGARGELLT